MIRTITAKHFPRISLEIHPAQSIRELLDERLTSNFVNGTFHNKAFFIFYLIV